MFIEHFDFRAFIPSSAIKWVESKWRFLSSSKRYIRCFRSDRLKKEFYSVAKVVATVLEVTVFDKIWNTLVTAFLNIVRELPSNARFSQQFSNKFTKSCTERVKQSATSLKSKNGNSFRCWKVISTGGITWNYQRKRSVETYRRVSSFDEQHSS